MGLVQKLRSYASVMRNRRQGAELEQLMHLKKRPALLAAVGAMESAQLFSGRVEARLKALAQIKTSALVGCPF